MMAKSLKKINCRWCSLLWTKTTKTKRTIIVSLSSDNCSREILLRLLASVAMPGDYVLAVHVLEPNDTFDTNSFQIHEDLCKSKQVDFQVKVCGGGCYITELARQVRINSATILAVGCSSPRPRNSTVANYLKALPPTCSLLVMDNVGRILMQRQGSSQEGSASEVLHYSQSCVSNYRNLEQLGTTRQIQKSLTMPSSSKSPSLQQAENLTRRSHSKALRIPVCMTHKLFERLTQRRRFTLEEIRSATNDFRPEMVIREGENSKVYQAKLDNGQLVAVKVLKNTESSAEDLFHEVEILCSLEHEDIVPLIGYCYCEEIHAIIYYLLKKSLNQRLKSLRWNERMRIAIGMAKALNYLHSRSPPIIHRDVKSSNILLSDNSQPQLSGFGAAIVHQQQNQQISGYAKPFHVVGTFGHLAPEYMMYGKIDEKIDVYSYGVVLLELITGKEAILTNQASNHESLVLSARSLLSCSLCERLIDPCLNKDYDKDEMKTMMMAARLCLLHSSSRRPSMKTILQLFEEPEQGLEMQRKREELLNGISSKGANKLVQTWVSNAKWKAQAKLFIPSRQPAVAL